MVGDPIEGSAAVPAPISQGFDYQIQYFLTRALEMLAEPEQRITAVEIEHDEAAGVDDVVVYYDANIDDPDRAPANAEYIQVKYKTSLTSVLRGTTLVDPNVYGGKSALLEKMARWWQECEKRHDVRLTLVTDADRDPDDPFFRHLSREKGTIAATFLTDARVAGLRERWQRVAALSDDDFAQFVRCLRIRAQGDSIESLKAAVLDVARNGLGMTGQRLGAALTEIGREIFHSRSRRYDIKRLLALLTGRGIKLHLPVRIIAPKTVLPGALRATADPESASLPVDVGTVWGLQTGRFLGLLEGGEPERVHEALCSAQSALEHVGESNRRRSWCVAMGFGWYDAGDLLATIRVGGAIGVVVEVLPIVQHVPYLFSLIIHLFADRERDVSVVLTFEPDAVSVVDKLAYDLRVKGVEIPIERLVVFTPDVRTESEELLATSASVNRAHLTAGLGRAAASEDLLERWLLAFGIARADEIYDLCRLPDPDHPTTVDRVALALLRLASKGVAVADTQRCLERIAPLLDATTERVVRWSMNRDATVDALDDDVEARLLVPRAGVGIHVLEIRPHSFDLSDAHIAQANMPTPDHVASLLHLSSWQRAVVGLCTNVEWRELNSSTNDDLIYMRHGRPLPAVPHVTTENPE